MVGVIGMMTMGWRVAVASCVGRMTLSVFGRMLGWSFHGRV